MKMMEFQFKSYNPQYKSAPSGFLGCKTKDKKKKPLGPPQFYFFVFAFKSWEVPGAGFSKKSHVFSLESSVRNEND